MGCRACRSCPLLLSPDVTRPTATWMLVGGAAVWSGDELARREHSGGVSVRPGTSARSGTYAGLLTASLLRKPADGVEWSSSGGGHGMDGRRCDLCHWCMHPAERASSPSARLVAARVIPCLRADSAGPASLSQPNGPSTRRGSRGRIAPPLSPPTAPSGKKLRKSLTQLHQALTPRLGESLHFPMNGPAVCWEI